MFGLIAAGISAIGSVLSTAVAAVGSACSAIGGAVISTGKVFIDAIEKGLPIVEKICDIVLTVGREIGIFSSEQPERDMYELGMRSERAIENGVSSEDFDSNKEYIDHLRKKIELSDEDVEKLSNPEKLTAEEKIKFTCLGGALAIARIKEQYEIDIPETFWEASVELNIEPEKVKPMLDTFERKQLNPDLSGFMKGELSSTEQSNIYDLIEGDLVDILSNESINKMVS